MDLSEKEFYIDDDPPTDPEELLELASRIYRQHLKQGENSPLHELDVDWDEVGKAIENAKRLNEEIKVNERLYQEAKAKADQALLDSLNYN